jgi:hypothetical protein
MNSGVVGSFEGSSPQTSDSPQVQGTSAKQVRCTFYCKEVRGLAWTLFTSYPASQR